MPSDIAVGIDLGTTYSCVAVYLNGKVIVITSPEGFLTTPSEVAFTEFEQLAGQAAKNQGALNPKNTIFDVKRLIGRKFDDPEIQSDIEKFPFRVVPKGSEIAIEVEHEGEQKEFTPEQISSMILQKMKDTAERYLGHEVKKAVITVPAYFNDGQRQATKDAAEIAGLEVLRVINEPTAAALAFGLDKGISKKQKVLVFDLGGGTFDVSIVTTSPGYVFEVNSTTGDTHFGGSDFDQILMKHFSRSFDMANNTRLAENPRAMRRLRTACEAAKRGLSEKLEENITVDSLFRGIDFDEKMTRVQFEELCEPLFLKILGPVEKALSDAKINKALIDEIVLVGGTTRIPRVVKILEEYFVGKKLNHSINPDEAVAYGAAVQAAILTKLISGPFEKLVLHDVTPLRLGIELEGGSMSEVIARNTRIPVSTLRSYSTVVDNQTSICFPVYEGERAAASDNHKLGEVQLTNIKRAPKGEELYDVTFSVNNDGILQVTAVERSTKNTNSVTINKGRLKDSEIQRMIEDAKRYEREDKLYILRNKALQKLKDYVYQLKDAIEKNVKKLPEADLEKMRKAWNGEVAWLEQNKEAGQEAIDLRFETIKETCGLIVS